jgi:hypothetical protein
MSGYQPARYKPAGQEGAIAFFRALCWWPRCRGELAEVRAIGQDEPGGPVMYAQASVPADWTQDQRGWWGEARRLPRRLFLSGMQGRRAVGGGIPFENGPRDAHGRPRMKVLKDVFGLGLDVVMRCPRCGEPSILCSQHFLAAFNATYTEQSSVLN